MRSHPRRDKVGPAPTSNGAEQTVTVATAAPPPPEPILIIEIDWNTVPMDQARTLYGELKSHFEKAGAILNNRSMPHSDHYICFMCHTRHDGDPRGKDYSRKDPRTGLLMPVSICGERCWIEYQDMCIKERKATEMCKELGYDQEMQRQMFERYERNLEGLINELGQRIMKARQ